jgi:hypothetical protein
MKGISYKGIGHCMASHGVVRMITCVLQWQVKIISYLI